MKNGFATCYRLLLVAFFAGVMGACGASSPYYADPGNQEEGSVVFSEQTEPQFTVFFIGDTGSPAADPPEPNLVTLQNHLYEAGENSAVVFLGDNIYSYGLLPQDHPNRVETERRIDFQINIVEDYSGQPIFIPGNHDWNDDRPQGVEAIKRQQQYIESRLGSAAFTPDNGCPGPVEIQLDSQNTLLILDTEWWLYPHEKPGIEQCANGSKEQFVQAVDSLVKQNNDRNLFVAGHHPLFTNGKHGGYFPAGDYFLPFPIIGTINPVYRKYWGYLQDMASKPYRELRKELIGIFETHPRLVYAGGHDHSLQHHPVGQQHYIVSGAGTVQNYVRKGKTAAFAYSHKGFARIDVYTERVTLSFWTPEGEGPQGKMVYQKKLYSN